MVVPGISARVEVHGQVRSTSSFSKIKLEHVGIRQRKVGSSQFNAWGPTSKCGSQRVFQNPWMEPGAWALSFCLFSKDMSLTSLPSDNTAHMTSFCHKDKSIKGAGTCCFAHGCPWNGSQTLVTVSCADCAADGPPFAAALASSSGEQRGSLIT